MLDIAIIVRFSTFFPFKRKGMISYSSVGAIYFAMVLNNLDHYITIIFGKFLGYFATTRLAISKTILMRDMEKVKFSNIF